MEVEGEVQKTTVKHKALWPVWRERFAFPVHESRVQSATISIEVPMCMHSRRQPSAWLYVVIHKPGRIYILDEIMIINSVTKDRMNE